METIHEMFLEWQRREAEAEARDAEEQDFD